jgi:hypothetical protein
VSFNITHAQGLLLAQIRPGGVAIVPAFKASNLRTEITLILCAIDPAGAAQANVAVYHDDATPFVFDQTTLILSETRLNLLQGNILFQAQHPGSGILIQPDGELSVSTSVADDVTFSIYGVTESLAERVTGRI